jgi:hypothetical protein
MRPSPIVPVTTTSGEPSDGTIPTLRLMGTLKLYCMKAAFDEIMSTAANADSQFHAPCRDRLQRQRARPDAWYTTWAILYELLRVTTHLRVMCDGRGAHRRRGSSSRRSSPRRALPFLFRHNDTPTSLERSFWSCHTWPAICSTPRTRLFSCARTGSGESVSATRFQFGSRSSRSISFDLRKVNLAGAFSVLTALTQELNPSGLRMPASAQPRSAPDPTRPSSESACLVLAAGLPDSRSLPSHRNAAYSICSIVAHVSSPSWRELRRQRTGPSVRDPTALRLET